MWGDNMRPGMRKVFWRRAIRLLLGFLLGLWGLVLLGGGAGCFAPVAVSCPGCEELEIERPLAVPAQTRTVFLLVPGLLGYGWEWNGAREALLRYPASRMLFYSWEPWHSLSASSERLAAHITYLRRSLPPSVNELFVIAHSAAGLLALEAAGKLPAIEPGQARVRILSVGAPLAGMGRNPWGGLDNRHTPLPIALGSRFSAWPPPAPGVTVEIYPTSSDDPVMQRSFGHDPGDRRVLPRGAIMRKLPASLGHNHALGWICEELVKKKLAESPPNPTAN
jgi:hypothetical protein